MAQALVLVEQGQLGSGVWPLAAHDDAGASRVAVQVDHAGQLGDLGTDALGVSQRTVERYVNDQIRRPRAGLAQRLTGRRPRAGSPALLYTCARQSRDGVAELN